MSPRLIDSRTETELERHARTALEALPLPGGGTLGADRRVSGLLVKNGRISAAIRVTAEEATRLEFLRNRAEAALRALPGVEQALVVLTAEAPVPASAPQHPRDAEPAPQVEVLPGVAQVVAVASGKGGVGKSTTAVNLALGLRSLGLRIGILDADVYGPSLPTLLGLRGKPRVGPGRKLLPMDAFGLKAMSMGLLVDDESPMVWRGPMVQSAITQMLAEVEWGRLDVLLVDMPPGTGDAQLAIAQGTRLSGAVIVSTPQDLSLIDARRGIAMFRKVEVPILGIIENMSYFLCPTCGAEHAVFGQGGARAEAARLGVPFLGAVPLTMELRKASDAGRPLVASDPDGVTGRIFVDIAGALRSAHANAGPTPLSPVPAHGGSAR